MCRSPHHPVNFEHSPIWARCKGYTLLEMQLTPVTQLLDPCILEQKGFRIFCVKLQLYALLLRLHLRHRLSGT